MDSKMHCFPVVSEHGHIRCFNCGHPLSGHITENGHHRGRFEQVCNACTLTTFYDIKGYFDEKSNR